MDVVKTKCLGNWLVPRRISKADYNKIISDAWSTLSSVIVGRRGNWSVDNNEWGRRFAEKA